MNICVNTETHLGRLKLQLQCIFVFLVFPKLYLEVARHKKHNSFQTENKNVQELSFNDKRDSFAPFFCLFFI